MSHVVKVSETLRSVIETDVLDHRDGDPDNSFSAIREAWNGSSLVVNGNTERLISSLNDLSNHCDYLAETREVNRDERKIYRRAATGFSNLIGKIRRKN